MFTRNFYNILTQMMRVRKGSSHDVTVTDYTGAQQTMTLFAPHSSGVSCAVPYGLLGGVCAMFAVEHGNYFGAFLGTGKTPATLDDYVMESPISDDGRLTIDTPLDSGLVVAVNPTYAEISATHAVTNNTSEPIEVTEIGLYGKLFEGKLNLPILLEHTVIDEPIVLPPGKTVPVNYAIRFPIAA